MAAPSRADPPLQERYTRTRGRVHLTGLQALVRLPLEQIRRDRLDGKRVAACFSGYPGSPLSGLDSALHALEPLLEREGVRLVPGQSEELAASAIAGTQLLEVFSHSEYDGVLGLWFGKAPGLDRALDAIRHANVCGTSRRGGALAIVGDDPFCKSSSLPSSSEHALAHAFVPVFAPSDPADILRLGLHAVAVSRYAGVWAALRVVADLADSGQVFELEPAVGDVEQPKFDVGGHAFEPHFHTKLLPPFVLEAERELVFDRLEAVRRYLDANELNPFLARHERDRLGLVASGTLVRELRSALATLGLDDAALEAAGIRVLKLDVTWPLEPRRVRELADGLDEIVVVDGRRGFVEEQLRSLLAAEPEHPAVLGQFDAQGKPWLARRGEVTASTLALDLSDHLAARLERPELALRVDPLRAALRRADEAHAPGSARTPHFCSGCPHSHSTRLPPGAVAGGGIGCHTMALLMERGVQYVGAMGSEGAHWIGLEPYTDRDHIFQNLGDGTYFHSGRLAVRACVEAGSHITFKLLYNGVVAMTGGQRAVGSKPVAAVVRDLLSDGVRKVVAMSSDPALRALAAREKRVEIITRADWDAAMREIPHTPGVSVMVYDQPCANQKQRLERRGRLPRPAERILINEDVCEGCGDCGARSSCTSLRPVASALGRKTRIHLSSCSDDRTCLAGDCPAFVRVAADVLPRGRGLPPDLPALPEPAIREPTPREPAGRDEAQCNLLLVGIGSTGVVTADALLVRAAELDGLHALHLDQTGLAQRGGKVVSHCIVSHEPHTGSTRIAPGTADLLLAFDPLAASDADARAALDPSRTRAVIHEGCPPTAEQVADPGHADAPLAALLEPLRSATREATSVPAEALCEAAFGTAAGANTLVLGTALQRGWLPVSRASLEQAIRDNGVAVEANLDALRLGRALAVDPALAERVLADSTPPGIGSRARGAEAAAVFGPAWAAFRASFEGPGGTELEAPDCDSLADLALDLRDYQNGALARGWLESIAALAAAEAEAGARPECAGDFALTLAAARELYRLTACKDEYEVARLMLHGPWRRWLERVTSGRARPAYLLHPPALRAAGLRRKLALGCWLDPFLRLLAAARRLRGTALDPMRWHPARRFERELAPWFADVLERIAARLNDSNRKDALEIVEQVQQIRGYEDVRAARIARVRPSVDAALARFEAGC